MIICQHGTSDDSGCRDCADDARREAFPAPRRTLSRERHAEVLATQRPAEPTAWCTHQQLDPDCPVCWEFIDEGSHWRKPDGSDDPERLSRLLGGLDPEDGQA